MHSPLAAVAVLLLLQVRTIRVAAVASSSLQQVAASSVGAASLLETPRHLLAARTAYSLSILEAREVEACDAGYAHQPALQALPAPSTAQRSGAERSTDSIGHCIARGNGGRAAGIAGSSCMPGMPGLAQAGLHSLLALPLRVRRAWQRAFVLDKVCSGAVRDPP